MPAFYGEWKMADGQWAVVRQLDRHDLRSLEEALPDWTAANANIDGEPRHGFEAF